MSGLVDYDFIINPKPAASPKVAAVVDFLSWMLPVVGAVGSIGAGVAALRHADAWAAGVGIAGGVAGALAVLFTNWASRIRDRRLAEARNLGALGVDMADRALGMNTSQFGP